MLGNVDFPVEAVGQQPVRIFSDDAGVAEHSLQVKCRLHKPALPGPGIPLVQQQPVSIPASEYFFEPRRFVK